MQARPLAQQLGDRPRIGQLVGRRTRPVIGRHIADAVAGGLDGMHLDLGQRGEDVGRVFELDPVELDVLAGGEMAVAAVPLLRDVGQAIRSGATRACHRERRCAACRREAADKARSSAAEDGTRPPSIRPSAGARPGRETARRARRRTDGRTHRSDTWIVTPSRTAGNRRHGLRPACRDRSAPSGPGCGCARGYEARGHGRRAARRRTDKAGDDIRRDSPRCRALRAPWRPAGSRASAASSIVWLQSPARVRNTTSPSRSRLAVRTLPVSLTRSRLRSSSRAGKGTTRRRPPGAPGRHR